MPNILRFTSPLADCEEDFIETWLPLGATHADGYKLIEDTERVFRFGKWVWVALGVIAPEGYHSIYTPEGYLIREIVHEPFGSICIMPAFRDEAPRVFAAGMITIEGRVVEVVSDLNDPFAERWVLARPKRPDAGRLRPACTL